MREILYREAIIEALDEEMARDDSVFLLGEDIAEFRRLITRRPWGFWRNMALSA